MTTNGSTPPPAGTPREEQRQIRHVASLIRELTSRAVRIDSIGELFSISFETLFSSVAFDVAVAVMIEQNLDLYIFTRADADSLAGDPLAGRIRDTLQSLIPASFETTDFIVKAEGHDLAPLDHGTPSIRNEVHTLLRVGNRVSGVLQAFRDEPFADDERQMFEIFASQVSFLLGSLSAREEIQKLAEEDELTGILNKRTFLKRLPQEIERARAYREPLSLLMFDVDDFKQINDSHGHTAGDVVLSEICGAVRNMLRPPDAFGRYGGDEFGIILPHTDLQGACSLAERILTRVRAMEVPTDEEGAIRFSVSIGVAEFQNDEGGVDALVRRADERLYLSKRRGKNRYTAA